METAGPPSNDIDRHLEDLRQIAERLRKQQEQTAAELAQIVRQLEQLKEQKK